MTEHWYALRSKPRKELTLWRQLQSRQVENFCPCIRVNPVNPRSSHVRPYFPGYLFVRADLEQEGQSKFNYMPYAIGLVGFGGEPAKVPADFILALRKRMVEIKQAGGELFYDMNQGDPVWITGGPFDGYRAIFDARISGEDRVRVLLEMLSDQLVPLEMNAAFIEKARNVRPAFRH
ncbi:MAG: transcription/translation regulatory transformer protein RfaH [Anaerolineae bacterium]|nr:MAG: transcription/translation regulatory transformer protein RfaH [Anaerolineae bacterium]